MKQLLPGVMDSLISSLLRSRSSSARLTALCLLFLVFLIPTTDVIAQTKLSRISAVNRKDGKGFVLRYHLTQAADSFDIYHPENDLIQMKIYGDNIDTTGLRTPPISKVFKDVELFVIENGYGVDIHLAEDAYYTTQVYSDSNKKDLLVAFTQSTKQKVDILTSLDDPINWIPEDVFSAGDAENSEYVYVKDKLKFDVVVIDAGHGGKDPGHVGYKGTQEKRITLAIAKKLGAYINKYLPDVKVVYTREGDTYPTLKERGEIANIAEGDLFISIHCNGFHDSRVRGTETFFLGLHKSDTAIETMRRENSMIREFEGPEAQLELSEQDLIIYQLANSGNIATSQDIAARVEDQFKNRARRHSRGVKQAGWQVLYEASMPAILVEAGFLTNRGEHRFLTSDHGQSLIASGIFRAVRDYKVEYDKVYQASTLGGRD